MHNLDQFFKIPLIPNPQMPPPLLLPTSSPQNTPLITFISTYRSQCQSQPIQSCFNNINYPTCDKIDHQCQPLTMVCIDQLCEKKGIICAFCQSQEHYGHVCVALKYYLDAVFGHLYQAKNQGISVQEQNKVEDGGNQLSKMEEVHIFNKNKHNKSKNKSKKHLKPYFSHSNSNTHSQVPYATFKNNHTKSNLYFTTKIQQQKNNLLTQISKQKQTILQKFHDLQTNVIKYYNKILQQATNLITIQNPLEQIQKILNNILGLDNQRNNDDQNQNQKQQKINNAGEGVNENNRKINKKLEYHKLRHFVSSILKQTKIFQKFNLSQKLQYILKNVTKNMNKIQQNLTKFQNTFDEMMTRSSQLLLRQLKIPTSPSSFSSFLHPKQFLFSQKLKGHKFTISNGNRTATQMGMQSSGQRFALLQPSIPKPNPFDLSQCYTWGIKINKIIGWVGVGISLKRKITQCKYFFNYTQTQHGSYLISANGYTWSHSATQFNSAYKSFTFTAGDIIYIQYNLKEKKLKFYKNQNQNKLELDVVDPPQGDQYCASVNMCSTGEEVEVVNVKPGFLNV